MTACACNGLERAGQGSFIVAAKLEKNTQTHKHTAFRNGLGWFEDGGMPIAYTHPLGVHPEHSSSPGQGDNASSVKLNLLFQTARLVYMQGDEDEVRVSNSEETESDNLSCMLPCSYRDMRVLNAVDASSYTCVCTGSQLAAEISRADCREGELYVCWLPSGDAFLRTDVDLDNDAVVL
jgi:hypothetical protein